jgi:hypothetical protein
VELRTKLSDVQDDIREIKDGTAAKLQFLETDKISRSEAVRYQTELVTITTDHSERITNLEDSRIEYRATIKAWISFVGVVNAIIAIGLAFYFH